MILVKKGEKISLDNEVQIAAYKASGWVEDSEVATAPPKNKKKEIKED